MTRRKPKRIDGLSFPFVHVVWRDSTSDARWCKMKELPKCTEITSRGWLLIDNEDAITIAATLGAFLDGDHAVGEVTTIPRGCIKSIEVLKV
jgi:hypothetical protein